MSAAAGEHSKGRLGIIAGRGRLPEHVAYAARKAGFNPFILPIIGEADGDWSSFDHEAIALADLQKASRLFRENGINRIVLSGGISRRPELREARPTWRVLARTPAMIRAVFGAGDDKLLRLTIQILEAEGVRVISAQDIAPAILAQTGAQGKHAPSEADRRDIIAARTAALALGKLDVGQGAISVGGRVVALEGLEGTDAMIARVAELRASGRLSRKHKGVLVKMCKPDQDLRADLPSIGPQTVDGARRAGLAGIAVEAGRSLILDREELIAAADAAGLFVFGLEPGGDVE